jgi:poly(3-hydroxybutyrate) depolymerase
LFNVLKRTVFAFIAAALFSLVAAAQAPKQYLDQLPPSPQTKVVTISYVNAFDGSPGQAMLELPPSTGHPLPLIVTPNAANWSQEMNRSNWSGVADRFGVMILYPRGQGDLNPNVTLGSPKQLSNLECAIAEVEKKYPVDRSRVYAAGISQGAIETLLLVGAHPDRFAGALALNSIPDCLAFYGDMKAFVDHPPEGAPDPVTKLRLAQWPVMIKLLEHVTGGTPDTARAAYYQLSAVIDARELAQVPLILYWAEDDELIPNGANHQGGMLANLIRTFHPSDFQEVKHTGGHGYPFYQVDLGSMTVKVFPRQIFLDSVQQLLAFRHQR